MSIVISVIGWIASFFSVINLIPQVIQAFKTKSVAGMAVLTILAFFIGNIFWITYGIGIKSWQILLSSSVQFIAAGILLWFKYNDKIKNFFKAHSCIVLNEVYV